MEGQNTIIHEGGDSYRPVIIIPINNADLWPNNNIAYFRSSGRTNKTPQYSNTWFPFGGIVEENNTKILSEPVNKGHIIKMSDLLKKRDSNWKTNLCMKYFRPLENQTFQNQTFEKIVNTLTPNSTNIDAVELLFNEAYLIKKFLDDYFFFDWQLRISAQIGGGFWDRNPKFCTFVLGLNSIPVINVPRMPDYFAEVEGNLATYVQGDVEGNNTDYIINFIKQNQSQLALPDGLTSLQTLENNNIPEIDPATKKDYENAIIRANGRIQEIRRTIALLAKYKPKPVKLEPEPEHVIPQNNIEQLNTLKKEDDIIPKKKRTRIEPTEQFNTNEATTRSTKIPDQPEVTDYTKTKRKRGGKTTKQKRGVKTTKRKRGVKPTKKRRQTTKKEEKIQKIRNPNKCMK
jgi:hypothetical protein